jgi:hypothetical protein
VWVAFAGTMGLHDFQPRRFLFLAVPVVLGLAPGFVLYALLRKALGLPLHKPGGNAEQPEGES